MFYPGMFKVGHSGNNIGTSLDFNSVVLAVFIAYSVPRGLQTWVFV